MRAREKHWLVSDQNAKGTVLCAPCQLTDQKNKELGSPDTLPNWRPWKARCLLWYQEQAKVSLYTPSRNPPAALLLLFIKNT